MEPGAVPEPRNLKPEVITMRRRTFLQTLLLSLAGPGRPPCHASAAIPTGPDLALGSIEPTDYTPVRHLFFGLGARAVGACGRFADRAGPRPAFDGFCALDPDDLPKVLEGVDQNALCLLVLPADEPRVLAAASRLARAIQTRGALLNLALVLHPPGMPWQRLAEEVRLTELRAATQALMLAPDDEPLGDAWTDPHDAPVQTLDLFALAPSLIDCDLHDLRQTLGSGGLWLARSAPFAGVEQGADPLAAIDSCLADLGGGRPRALIAKWQAGLRDISLATYDGIADACARRVAPAGEVLVTTGLLPMAAKAAARLLLLARAA